jgi:hypothetical protein
LTSFVDAVVLRDRFNFWRIDTAPAPLGACGTLEATTVGAGFKALYRLRA